MNKSIKFLSVIICQLVGLLLLGLHSPVFTPKENRASRDPYSDRIIKRALQSKVVNKEEFIPYYYNSSISNYAAHG
ncbi:MAG: hypothetical protein P8Y62_09900, partial [candidate division WOR-3 bacterium]